MEGEFHRLTLRKGRFRMTIIPARTPRSLRNRQAYVKKLKDCPHRKVALGLATRHKEKCAEFRKAGDEMYYWLYDELWSRREELEITNRAFAIFCKDGMGLSKRQTFNQMKAIAVHDHVLGRPINRYPEIVYRSLAQFSKPDQTAIWAEVDRTRPVDHRPEELDENRRLITGAHVRRTVNRMFPPPVTGEVGKVDKWTQLAVDAFKAGKCDQMNEMWTAIRGAHK